MESKSDFEGLYTSALLTAKWGVVAQKRGREPIVRSTLRAIWLLVPDPFECTCESCGICRKVVGEGFSI